MEGSSVANTKISRLGLILKIVPLRSPTKRFPTRSNASPVAVPIPSIHCSPRPAERHVNIAFGIHGRISNGVQIIRNLHGQRNGIGLAFAAAADDLNRS